MESPTSPRGRGMRLEKVFGISGLVLDTSHGVVAYPAGCVVVLQNIATGKQQAYMRVPKPVSFVKFSPDGKYLGVGERGRNPAVTVWDVESHRKIAELKGHSLGIKALQFSPDSKRIASVGFEHDDLLILWDWQKGKQLSSATVPSPVLAMDYARDGSYLVTVGEKFAKFWMIHDNSFEKEWTAHSAGLMPDYKDATFTDVKCLEDGSTLMSTMCGSLLSVGTNRLLDKWVFLEASHCFSLSLCDDSILCGCSEGVIRVFNSHSLEFKATLPLPNENQLDNPDVSCARFSGLEYAVVIYSNRNLFFWDITDPDNAVLHNIVLSHENGIMGIQPIPAPANSKPVADFATCSDDGDLRIWRIGGSSSSKKRRGGGSELILQVSAPRHDATSHHVELKSIAVSTDGKFIAVGSKEGSVSVYSMEDEEWIKETKAHESEVLCLAFSPFLRLADGTTKQLLVSGSRDRLVRVFDVSKTEVKMVQTLREHSSAVTSLCFSNNGEKLISCGGDKMIVLLAVDTSGNKVSLVRQKSINVPNGTMQCVDVDASNKYFCTVGQDKKIHLWALQNGKAIRSYKPDGDHGDITNVRIDPAGMYCATAWADKAVRIFDFYTGDCIAKGTGHSELITGFGFSQDCKRIVSVAADGTMLVWRLAPEITTAIKDRLREMDSQVNFQSAELPSWAKTNAVLQDDDDDDVPGLLTVTDVPAQDLILEDIPQTPQVVAAVPATNQTKKTQETRSQQPRSTNTSDATPPASSSNLKGHRENADDSVRKMRDRLQKMGILQYSESPPEPPGLPPAQGKEAPEDLLPKIEIKDVKVPPKDEEVVYNSDFESEDGYEESSGIMLESVTDSTMDDGHFVYTPGVTKLKSAEDARLACDSTLRNLKLMLGNAVQLFREVDQLDNTMQETIETRRNTVESEKDDFTMQVLETSRSHVCDIIGDFKQQLTTMISKELQNVEEISSARAGSAFGESMFGFAPNANGAAVSPSPREMQQMMSKLNQISSLLEKVVPQKSVIDEDGL